MAEKMSEGYMIPFEEMLKCSICQDRIKDARSLHCGHTYCTDCLKGSADGSHHQRSIKCSDCSATHQLPTGAVERLPRCFATNILVEDINETFGGGDSRGGSTSNHGNGRDDQVLSLGKHRFEVEKIFSCPICLNLMRDARYLPCGHSYCRECLEVQQPGTAPGTAPGIKCAKCQKDHNLPPGGIKDLPAAYRINSIVAEIRSNDTGNDDVPNASSTQTSQYKSPRPSHSSNTGSRTNMEDVDEAKERARSQVGNHSRKSPDTRSRSDMEDVDEAKKRAQTQARLASTHTRPSQDTRSRPTMGSQAQTDWASGTTGIGKRVSTPYRNGPNKQTKTQPKSGLIQIQVRDFSGKTHMVRVNPHDKVEHLKVKVEEAVGIEPSQQQLHFNGKILNDKSTCSLQSLGLDNLCTVQVQGRMIGGSP